MDHRAVYCALSDAASVPGCASLRVLCVCPQTIDLKPGSVCLNKEESNGIKEK